MEKASIGGGNLTWECALPSRELGKGLNYNNIKSENLFHFKLLRLSKEFDLARQRPLPTMNSAGIPVPPTKSSQIMVAVTGLRVLKSSIL